MTNLSKFKLYKLLSFIAFLLPFLFLIVTFKDMFFATMTGTKFTLYGYISLIFIAVAFKKTVAENVKKNPTLSLSIFMLITSFVFRTFCDQLLIISIAGFVGSLLSNLIEPVSEVYFNLCYEMNGVHKKRIHSENITHKEGWKRAYR